MDLTEPVSILNYLELTLREFSSNTEQRGALEIDFAQLLKSVGGNKELIEVLLQKMLSSSREDLSTLDSFSVQSLAETEVLEELAHRIKGAAKIIKAGPLVAHCELLELACRKQGIDEVRLQQRELHTYLTQFCDTLQVELGDSGGW